MLHSLSTAHEQTQSNRVCNFHFLFGLLALEGSPIFQIFYITLILDFGCIIWKHAKSNDISRISKLQKRIARVVLSRPLRSNTNNNFRTLNWLSFKNRTKYFTAIMAYKTIHGLVPSYINNMVQISLKQRYNLRSNSSETAFIQTPKTNFMNI